MIIEEAANQGDGVKKKAGGLTTFSDSFIRARESVLNRLSGANGSVAINRGLASSQMMPNADLAARLKQTLDELKVEVMDAVGARVDYAALRVSPAYEAYKEECLAALIQFKPDSLPTEEAQRAFWINLYNALVLDAVISFSVERSVIEGRLGILAFFRRAAYLVDSKRVSLEDIEHGILRGNRGNPYLPDVHFKSDDPRLKWSLPVDPRIHFALNCGGRSCPPIRSYTPEKLDAQLDLATQGFLDSTVEVKPEKNLVVLSKIFNWYAGDFGGKKKLVDFLIHYLPDDSRRELISEVRDDLHLSYRAYDWGLNTLQLGRIENLNGESEAKH